VLAGGAQRCAAQESDANELAGTARGSATCAAAGASASGPLSPMHAG
jgi:hypothetical protein